jgi:hypothetical protein
MQELCLGRVHCQCSPATNEYVNDLENALLNAEALLQAIARDARPETLSPVLWEKLTSYVRS